ncbi:hypothetical protein RHMOL_Rhmol13G0180000 [Rhododendron molle]|uniref:Uncharacterized protein n=1 Tax=Rhododendron molle TaxID=49168 RepID=A0ACC0L9B0_RHOML|nr:hypothetical protein RHMOL_Rhmol13G0180000 [Rhododendron molle]
MNCKGKSDIYSQICSIKSKLRSENIINYWSIDVDGILSFFQSTDGDLKSPRPYLPCCIQYSYRFQCWQWKEVGSREGLVVEPSCPYTLGASPTLFPVGTATTRPLPSMNHYSESAEDMPGYFTCFF